MSRRRKLLLLLAAAWAIAIGWPFARVIAVPTDADKLNALIQLWGKMIEALTATLQKMLDAYKEFVK